MEKGEFLFVVDGNVNQYSQGVKQCGHFFKLELGMPCDAVISPVAIYPKGMSTWHQGDTFSTMFLAVPPSEE